MTGFYENVLMYRMSASYLNAYLSFLRKAATILQIVVSGNEAGGGQHFVQGPIGGGGVYPDFPCNVPLRTWFRLQAWGTSAIAW